MNLRTPRLAATLAATGVAAALVLASPMGADAAKMITGKDIKNGSITAKDVKDGTLTAKDFAGGQAGPVGPAGAAGKDAPKPSFVTFSGSYTKVAGTTQVQFRSSQTIPAYSQVTGIDVQAPGLSSCSFYNVEADAGSTEVAYLYPGDGAAAMYLPSGNVGSKAAPVTIYLSCNGDVPSTTFSATLAYTPVEVTPATAFTGTQVPTSNPGGLSLTAPSADTMRAPQPAS